MNVLFFGSVLGAVLIGFGCGVVVAQDICSQKYERELQKKVRPANIVVRQVSKVEAYTVQPGALDLDFPNSEAAV